MLLWTVPGVSLAAALRLLQTAEDVWGLGFRF